MKIWIQYKAVLPAGAGVSKQLNWKDYVCSPRRGVDPDQDQQIQKHCAPAGAGVSCIYLWNRFCKILLPQALDQKKRLIESRPFGAPRRREG